MSSRGDDGYGGITLVMIDKVVLEVVVGSVGQNGIKVMYMDNEEELEKRCGKNGVWLGKGV